VRIQIGSLDLSIGQTKAAGSDLITTFPADFPGINRSDGWWTTIRESFSGAWQRNIVTTAEDALAHPTFWACVTLIAGDIAKGAFSLMKEDEHGITVPVENGSFSPVLRRPNHYQNRIQFTTSWILSKLCRGNTYALKERDGRGVVDALYLLDPTRVKPLVSASGDVYYQIGEDPLSGVGPGAVVPAREIIHDLMNPLYHPLCGLGPVYASGHAALQALQIMRNSSRLTRQGFQPGGIVTSALPISDENAKKFEQMWEANYMGPENIGRVVVLAGGLEFKKPDIMSAVDAEIIKLLDWDDLKICSTFHVPPYMVGVGAAPTYNNIEALNQQYYSQCLQILIESIELCLEEGLGVLDSGYEIEFDMDALLRMDSATKMKTVTDGIKGGVYTPNEGRLAFNKKPLKGGDTVYLQEQDHSLQWLSDRDDQGPPPITKPVATAPPVPTPVATQKAADETPDVAVKHIPQEHVEDLAAWMLSKELAAA
jgi:HK97 family phage portal protein